MKRHVWIWISVSVAALIVVGTNAGVVQAHGDFAALGLKLTLSGESDAPEQELSPYWPSRVHHWGSLIVKEADRRELDPDLLASLVWMESRGDTRAVGPVGAVGLMQVMPREAGFGWRPTEEQLKDPATNLFWGTRTLATVIGQGKGDIFNALAAYNGGWDQIMYRGPTVFATTILRDYAHAKVVLKGVSRQHWMAFFAVKDRTIHGPIWVADSERSDVYFFRQDNQLPDGAELIPDVSPTAYVASCEGPETHEVCEVGLWLFLPDRSEWVMDNRVDENRRFVPQIPPMDSLPEARRPDSEGRGAFLAREAAWLVGVARPQPVSLGIMPGSPTESD